MVLYHRTQLEYKRFAVYDQYYILITPFANYNWQWQKGMNVRHRCQNKRLYSCYVCTIIVVCVLKPTIIVICDERPPSDCPT